MLSPADLLDMAESFAARIPRDPAYEEERQISWELLGCAFLHSGNTEGAIRALRQLSVGEEQAALRWDFVMWVSDHPESTSGLHILRETIDQISQWEHWFARREFSELTPIVRRLLGETALRRMADGLEDSFTKTIVLTTWACITDPVPRRTLLKEAEELAMATHPGNRDWALRQVAGAYRESKWDGDAERVRTQMERDSDAMDAPIHQAQEVLKKVSEVIPPPKLPLDSAAGRLSRFLSYSHNDLKVRWLTEQATKGGLDDLHLEAQLADEPFHRVETPRQPSIHRDPSYLAPSEFAAFFFARAVPLRDSDDDLLRGDSRYSTELDPHAFSTAATRLFSDFGIVGQKYSQNQIDQGLWFLFSYPHMLFEQLMKDQVPEESRIACLEAMVVPFRDYLQTAHDYTGTAFHMWWHHVRDGDVHKDTVPVCRRILIQILALSNKKCQFAALHGLNHLQPDLEGSAIIDRYLNEHRGELMSDDIEWIEHCREGKAL